uniref:protein-ribulosamine 3-kinase n=1 Tax=Timema monikensis TaxID=170555 RepID=A0A7R9E8Y2_9NEOP|nr:unnamed protein product [Timema monikensis]
MEDLIKKTLGTATLKKTGVGGGGCINEGEAYFTDTGTIFVKRNAKKKAKLLFDGEFASLKALLATRTVRVPEPITVLDNPAGGALLVMEYLDMRRVTRFSRQLAESLARLHLHNVQLGKKGGMSSIDGVDGEEDVAHISEFGFHTTTCCGYLPLDNTWNSDWAYGDREALELWSQLNLKVPSFFKGLEVQPSLLHGDLWSGNIAETDNEPVIFDPAAFYGHHEFDLSIAGMFGGFDSQFYDAYHRIIPKAPGFEKRHKLYQLFHHLNHWNHFGSSYRSSSVSIMKSLLK